MNFELGRPQTANSDFEWSVGDGADSRYASGSGARVYCGTFSLEIQSNPNNWNTQPNWHICGQTGFGAAMDLRSKTFTMNMFFDGPTIPNASCSFAVFDPTGSTLIGFETFLPTFGQWFQYSKFMGGTVAQASDIVFQCNFTNWPGNLFIDDVTIN